METLTGPLLTQLSTEAHIQARKNHTVKCTGADTGRPRHKPYTQLGTNISIDRGMPQQVSFIVPQEREFTKETKTPANGEITKEQFAKMGYGDRMKIYSESPELYNELKGD